MGIRVLALAEKGQSLEFGAHKSKVTMYHSDLSRFSEGLFITC